MSFSREKKRNYNLFQTPNAGVFYEALLEIAEVWFVGAKICKVNMYEACGQSNIYKNFK